METTSLYEIGMAVTFLDQCFLPVFKNLTGIEEELYKKNAEFQFYLLMNTASDEVVELVRTLRILVRSDDRLTQGGVCSIPRPTCITPIFTQRKENVGTSYYFPAINDLSEAQD